YASLLFQANLKRWAFARCPGLTNDSFVAEICLESGDCLACFVLPDKGIRTVEVGQAFAASF
ncbi:hypothetical protein, partial [Slackia isoflavoniconvertens]|uniref:hypothetical protein n=1 Tax=Slackia isoflavoniconvertens TaxID=572010 RepID=UPI003AF0DF0C